MKLTVVEEGVQTQLELPGSVITIGRALDNDIRLSNTLVSRHHSRIDSQSGGAWVIDLGSANGTSVNGEKISRRLLGAGDEIDVGGTRLILETDDGETEGLDQTQRLPGADDLDEDVGMRTLSGEGRRERENLRVFARITRELVRETDLMPLLRSIVDSAVSLVGGERGFILLKEQSADEQTKEGGGVSEMTVRIARSFDHSDIVVPRSRLSMGIASNVVRDGKAVLSVDASQDDRFEGMASVEDLRLRSVMCLPIEADGGLEGVLYLDNRLQFGAFSQEDLELVELFASQASIAIRNANLVGALREKNQRLEASREQIGRLNEQLGRKVRDRDTQLAVVRAELGRERGRYDYTAIVGASDAMRKIFQQLDRIIESDLPVLIEGESGTGKELIARAIHFNGARKERPFVIENCAAIPDALLESELFGHVRGAFTGAYKSRKGLLEQADGGTLFLDEIGDMSAEMQKKLLRVMQEGEFRVLGSDRIVKVDVRVLAASHKKLEDLVRDGKFREDLYYRTAVLSVPLPPLRQRRDDIPILAEHLLARAAREAGSDVPDLPHEVMSALVSYDWPGNVRELENELRRVVVLGRDGVQLEHLSDSVRLGRSRVRVDGTGGEVEVATSGELRVAVAELERRSIEAALVQAGGNKSRAASQLGISRFALQRKLDKYGLGKSKSADQEEQGPDSDHDA
ncbi:MAG: transcriptional regulator with GAF, ATPase, and Fis domain [Planctomycetota bacterium]|jgi:transcriptional regulator with GAF, ATPase, and Fis domain